jgi:hypothetical protein
MGDFGPIAHPGFEPVSASVMILRFGHQRRFDATGRANIFGIAQCFDFPGVNHRESVLS